MNAFRLNLAALDTLRLLTPLSPRSDRHGERRGSVAGGRMEFVDYRPYAPGDDLRRVDWNVAARTDRLFLKQYLREVGLPVHLLLDVSRSMTLGAPSALETAQELARGLAYIALARGDTVSVAGFGSALTNGVRTSGKGGLARVEHTLRALMPQAKTDFARALRGYAYRATQAGTAIVFTDLLDIGGYQEGLRSLRVRRFDVAVVHLVTPEFLEPRLPAQAQVTDAETGAARDVTWDADTQRAYRERLTAFLTQTETWCVGHHFRYARVRTDQPLADVFLKELRAGRIVA